MYVVFGPTDLMEETFVSFIRSLLQTSQAADCCMALLIFEWFEPKSLTLASWASPKRKGRTNMQCAGVGRWPRAHFKPKKVSGSVDCSQSGGRLLLLSYTEWHLCWPYPHITAEYGGYFC
ncbi:hypothetical protein GOODEAATRI_026592 [Goodea atripinnis]|uniref:Uncharacterized protein n=1 Tax=Goodea atripinnis TaxID=208336 RepID=A0ABV0PHB2_9TELE